MKNLKNFVVSSLAVGGFVISLGNQAFAADARALFLSTAGTQINYTEGPSTQVANNSKAKQPTTQVAENNNNNNNKNNKKPTEIVKTKTKIVYKRVYVYKPEYHKVYYHAPKVYYHAPIERASERIPAGLSIEVMKVSRNGTAYPVNPSIYRFRNGDEFAVSFESNTPGYVRIYNINPSGDVNYLGTYVVPAFMRVQLPKNGYFKFTGERGREKLVFQLYPCRYETSSYGGSSSRDIVLTSPNSYGRVSDEVLESLPSCEPTNNGLRIGSQVVAYNNSSRDIVLSGANPRYSSYEGGSTYYVDQIDSRNVKPITAVINFLHR